jgi:hypothetical protein
MENKYVKLSALVDSEFTINKVNGYKYQAWDAQNNRMISEDDWFKDSKKVYAVDTDKGQLNLSESQLGTIFVKIQHAGQSDVNGCTVAVKSNGKSGIDIRYYLNPQKVQPSQQSEGYEDLPADW